ncbi:hypothetical protein EXIGLDRAFT_839679 [Exidia glandulosa HHB12029]|uniref:Uncharacterized protein n=1 Tax=Exidia glandulosa HHB12029 TaxID=1314781 RepID=A0A165EWA5_EXIGL|nr:hypothetical protein EXIGLDRAFT_839679 [Exidia glandulosa HHB12029]
MGNVDGFLGLLDVKYLVPPASVVSTASSPHSRPLPVMVTVIGPDAWDPPKNIISRFDVQRAAARTCPATDIPAEALLLTQENATQGTAVLTFQGTAVTVYGAALSLQHLRYRTFIDTQPVIDHTFAPTGCWGPLATYSGLDPITKHTLFIEIVYDGAIGDATSYLAIYNGTVEGAPSETTPSSSSTIINTGASSTLLRTDSTPSQSPSSSSTAAQTIQQTPSSSNATDAASRPPPDALSSKTARFVALIAAPMLVALLVLFGFVCYLRRRRSRRLRYPLPGEELLRPYNYDVRPSSASDSIPMHSVPGAETLKHPELALTITPASTGLNTTTFVAAGSSTPSPRDAKYQALNLKPPPSSPSPSEMISPDSAYSSSSAGSQHDVNAPLLPGGGGSGPEDVAALEAAVRRAGFSIQSVVASLNRLSVSQSPYVPAPNANSDDSEAPPLYERRIGNGR